MMNSHSALSQSAKRRRAVVTVMVLVVLMLMAGILAQLVRRAVADRRQIRQESFHQQTIELAFAGVIRVTAKHRSDGEYSGEIWNVPAGQIHQTNSGQVEISIDGDSAVIVARYPSNLEHPVQVTKTVSLSQ